MITRSKAKALKTQANLNARKRAPPNAPLRQPSSSLPTGTTPSRQPSQLPASRRDQGNRQQRHDELEAAMLAAAIQMAVNPNRTGARIGQRPIDDPAFDATALGTQAATSARQDLVRTSFKIAVQCLQITLMASQASVAVHQKVASLSTYITAKEQNFWPGLFAVTSFVVLLRLFDVFGMRRVLTLASLGERVTASAAIFLGIAERLKERLEWMLVLHL
jgi:hypothetical protein